MARNLREKIRAIVADGYDLRQESLVTRLERLVEDELELQKEDRTLTYYDLMTIQSFANKEFVDMKMDSETLGRIFEDQPMIRILCIVNATVSFLRSKNLLKPTITYRK